jgi:hypothetical protein
MTVFGPAAGVAEVHPWLHATPQSISILELFTRQPRAGKPEAAFLLAPPGKAPMAPLAASGTDSRPGLRQGQMAEWSNAHAWKACVR